LRSFSATLLLPDTAGIVLPSSSCPPPPVQSKAAQRLWFAQVQATPAVLPMKSSQVSHVGAIDRV
jgi:hypothetical protein